jgi:hypothetical protein
MTTEYEAATLKTRVEELKQTLRAVYLGCAGIHDQIPAHQILHLITVEIPSLIEAVLPGETAEQMDAALRDPSLPPLPIDPSNAPDNDDIPF